MDRPPSPLSSSSSCSTATSALVVVRSRRAAGKPRHDRPPMVGDFICATCMKAFPSMRALGGHQNAHRNRAVAGEGEVQRPKKQPRAPARPALPAVSPPALAPVPAAPVYVPARQELWHAAQNGDILWQYPWERLAPEPRHRAQQMDPGDLDLDLDLHL